VPIPVLKHILIVSGVIEHLNYAANDDKSWPVKSVCESVWLKSVLFDMTDWDFILINGIKYDDHPIDGNIPAIGVALDSNFTVDFHSSYDSGDAVGFSLKWNCISWSSWSSANDGTCRLVSPGYSDNKIVQYKYARQRDGKCKSGIIKLINYGNNANLDWPIDPDCDHVQTRVSVPGLHILTNFGILFTIMIPHFRYVR